MSLMVGRALGECYKSDTLLSSTENLLNFITSTIFITEGKMYVLPKIITVKRLLVTNNLSYYGEKTTLVSFTVKQVKITRDSIQVGVVYSFSVRAVCCLILRAGVIYHG